MRQGCYLAGPDLEDGSVGHRDPNVAAYVVLEVSFLAQLGDNDRPDVLRPPPAGLQRQAPDLAAADAQQVLLSTLERARFVGCCEILLFPARFDGRSEMVIRCCSHVRLP